MPAGNESNHVIQGLTVQGGFALEGRSGDVVYLGTDLKVAPQMGRVVWTADPRTASTTSTATTNAATASKAIMPCNGILTDLSIFIGVASGNHDIGVYDCDATTLTKLYSAGTTASVGTGWISFQPALAVTAGQALFFVWAADNATITRGLTSCGTSAMSTLPTGFVVAAGQTTRQAWTLAASFPLPATFTVSGLSATTAAPIMIARIV